MKTSDKGVDFIKGFEKLMSTVYNDAVGKPTVGYGHLIKVGETFDEPLTEEQATLLMRADLAIAEDAINSYVTSELNQNRFDALVSLVFNIGVGNFVTSTLLKLLNEGEFVQAADQFPRWNKAGGEVLAGLTRRRDAEMDMFNS